MGSSHIHEYLLNGIANLLKTSAPALLPIVESIQTTGSYQPLPIGGRSTDYKVIYADVPQEDAAVINDALEEFLRIHGRTVTFQGWHVDFLAISWRRFTGLKEGAYKIE